MEAIIPIVLSLVQKLPAAQKALREIFTKADPTDADWDAARAKVVKTYAEHVPNSKLPREPEA